MVADIARLEITRRMPRLRPPGQSERHITWLSFRNVSTHSYGMPSVRITRTSASPAVSAPRSVRGAVAVPLGGEARLLSVRRRPSAGGGRPAQVAMSRIRTHVSAVPAIVISSVSRDGWLAWASGRMSLAPM